MSDYLKPDKNNLFKKIRSGVKLKQIFSCLEKKKTLKIIKYNKQIKRRLNLDYSDYKPFCTIEIELFPIENKYGKFVNILNNDEEKYYHFYFNDSENETKRNTINENDNVTKIKIIYVLYIGVPLKLIVYDNPKTIPGIAKDIMANI